MMLQIIPRITFCERFAHSLMWNLLEKFRLKILCYHKIVFVVVCVHLFSPRIVHELTYVLDFEINE